jgi:hypothetical protein
VGFLLKYGLVEGGLERARIYSNKACGEGLYVE